MNSLPKHIAICGQPKSGKSELQKAFSNLYGYIAVDDGFPLRDFAMRFLGLSHDDVLTQEGKLRETEILGQTMTNRKLLGDYGAKLEEMFGPNIMPHIAVTRALRDYAKSAKFTYGSCRREQGHFYRGIGGQVIEIVRPGVKDSEHFFDQYDKSAVTYTIINDGTIKDLVNKVRSFTSWHQFGDE